MQHLQQDSQSFPLLRPTLNVEMDSDLSILSHLLVDWLIVRYLVAFARPRADFIGALLRGLVFSSPLTAFGRLNAAASCLFMWTMRKY